MESTQLRRALSLRDLIFYGIICIQPTAPMPLFGVAAQLGKGHVVTTVLIAMVAMLFTAVSYGRMARVYPSAGSAYAYIAGEFGKTAGFLTGWSIMLDYLLNPLICTVWCSAAAANLIPAIPPFLWKLFFALLFTMLNLRGIEASARTNEWLAVGMGAVVVWALIDFGRYVYAQHPHGMAFFTRPFYDPATFSIATVSTGASLAALTYIGFDTVSTLSEEALNPKRDILRATVLVCLITGVMAAIEVYAAQLVWPDYSHFPDVDTAYVYVAGRAGGALLFHLVNATLLVATIGSGMGAQIGAARVLYGMGRGGALPAHVHLRGSQQPRAQPQRAAVRGHRAGGRVVHDLRVWRGAAELRRVSGLHRSQRGFLPALLHAQARAHLEPGGAPSAGDGHLPVHLDEPALACQGRRFYLARRRHNLLRDPQPGGCLDRACKSGLINRSVDWQAAEKPNTGRNACTTKS